MVTSQTLARMRCMSVRRVARYLKLTAFAALTSLASLPVHALGQAPDPATTPEAVVQVYGARTMGVKGIFGVHTWIAVKPANALSWTVYEIIGWRLRWSDSALVIRERQPDAPWFGSVPELYADKRGVGVEELIARAVPELQVDLPATAVGKDYIGSTFVSTAPSGTGFQFTLAGVFGVAASPVDGFELNLLGLNFGVSGSGVKLPMVGRVGLPHFFETAKR